MSQDSKINVSTSLPVLSFLIEGYKNERSGRNIDIEMAHDAFDHNDPTGVSEAIAKVLNANGLGPEHIINITATTAYGNASGRDVGSWEFWLFCRNPNFGKKMTPWGPEEDAPPIPTKLVD